MFGRNGKHVTDELTPLDEVAGALVGIGALNWGLVGVANVGGTGTGTDLTTGETTKLVFDADMRFMQGAFVDMSGHRRHGTFGFV